VWSTVRIRALGLLVALLVVATGCDWGQLGFDAGHTGSQPLERTIGPANVAGLTQRWSAQIAARQTPISPAVVGGIVYMVAEGFVYAVDADTGVRVWKAPVSGFAPSSPAVSDGVVFVAGDRLQAFAAGGCGTTTCAALWTSDVFPPPNPSTPSLSGSPAVAGGVVYVDALQLFAFDASGCGSPTCAPLWSSPSQPPRWALSTPAVADGVVYTPHGGLSAFDASGCGAAECAPLWTTTVEGTASGPAVAGGIAYVPSDNGNNTGTLTAFRVADCSGASCAPLWKASTGGHSETFVFLTPDTASAAIAGGVVYVAANEGTSANATLYAFRATGCGTPTCLPLWTAQAPGRAWSSPTVANGVVYLGTGLIWQHGAVRESGALVAFAANGCGASTCAPLWQSASTTVESSAAIVNGAVYVATLPLSSSKGAILKFQLPATSS
jgi:outer membrane protein assembly factor BamB